MWAFLDIGRMPPLFYRPTRRTASHFFLWQKSKNGSGKWERRAETLKYCYRKKYPESYNTSLKRTEEGFPRVLEAIGEGVLFTSLEHAAGADSLSVFAAQASPQKKRPRLYFVPLVYAGRPYDFNFDFFNRCHFGV